MHLLFERIKSPEKNIEENKRKFVIMGVTNINFIYILLLAFMQKRGS